MLVLFRLRFLGIGLILDTNLRDYFMHIKISYNKLLYEEFNDKVYRKKSEKHLWFCDYDSLSNNLENWIFHTWSRSHLLTEYSCTIPYSNKQMWQLSDSSYLNSHGRMWNCSIKCNQTFSIFFECEFIIFSLYQ